MSEKAPTTPAHSLGLNEAENFVHEVGQLIDIPVSGLTDKEPTKLVSVTQKWHRVKGLKVNKPKLKKTQVDFNLAPVRREGKQKCALLKDKNGGESKRICDLNRTSSEPMALVDHNSANVLTMEAVQQPYRSQ